MNYKGFKTCLRERRRCEHNDMLVCGLPYAEIRYVNQYFNNLNNFFLFKQYLNNILGALFYGEI